MKDKTEGKLQEALEFAKTINDNSLQSCLDRLDNVDKNSNYETIIHNDFAYMSFYFERVRDGQFRSDGGIIYHGNHDGFGSGYDPTFSVSVTPTSGWSIHT